MLEVQALRTLLAVLGRLLSEASRVDPILRRCITRDVVFEISTEDGVARHWRFDGSGRRVSSHAGRAADADCVMRFADSGVALRALTASDQRVVDQAMEAGTMRIDGSPAIALWFGGLARRLTTVARWRPQRRPLPHAYVEHDESSRSARYITVEPPQVELDPTWEAAHRQRQKLLALRVPAGEPLEPF